MNMIGKIKHMKKIEIKKNDIIYIDMDGVLVKNNTVATEWKKERIREGYFLEKEPMHLAIKYFHFLSQRCNVYILSTPVWDNIHCWTEKRIWVEKHLGESAKKKLILTHNKGLNVGKVLIDDSKEHGVSKFSGIHIHFGNESFPSWKEVVESFVFTN